MQDKLQVLERILTGAGRIAVAFSGGTDSTFLLAFAAALPQVDALAITVSSPLMPDPDLAFARRFCEERGIRHVICEVDPLADAQVRANTPERCYLCKRIIMGAVKEEAQRAGARACDGSNADDVDDFRPGRRALEELGIESPLEKARLTKREIRRAAREMDLPTWNKPASACLASRIPYGTPLDERVLRQVSQAECALMRLGFTQVRVRAHGEVARVEVAPEEMERLLSASVREEANRALSNLGFAYVAADLAGYRQGSLNEGVEEARCGR